MTTIHFSKEMFVRQDFTYNRQYFDNDSGMIFYGAKCMEQVTRKGERVRSSTAPSHNQKIDDEIIGRLKYYSKKDPATIDKRIKALDQTWDIERTLELNAAVLGLTGSLLAVFVNKKWIALPVIVTTFLIQHAVQGWCPPLPLFRKLGIRTRPELDREKYALKLLKGDFKNANGPLSAWKAVNK